MTTKTTLYWGAGAAAVIVLAGLTWELTHTQSQGRDKSRTIASLHEDLNKTQKSLKESQQEAAKSEDEAAQRAKETEALNTKLKATENALSLLQKPSQRPVGPKLGFTVSGVTTASSGLSTQGFPDRNLDVFVDAVIANSGDESDIITFDDLEKNVKLVGDDGVTYFMPIGSGEAQNKGKNQLSSQTVYEGQSAKGVLLFVVDKNLHKGKVYFRDLAVDVSW